MDNQDFLKFILSQNDVVKSIRENLDELTDIIPEIDPMIGFQHHHPHHHLDVWEHTLLALSLAPNDFDIRLALLFHDIGKPSCFQNDYGVRHFRGHPKQSEFLAGYILKGLGYKEDYVEYIKKLVLKHDIPLREKDIIDDYDFSKVLFEVQKCDALAHNPEKNAKRLKYIEETTKLFQELNPEKE